MLHHKGADAPKEEPGYPSMAAGTDHDDIGTQIRCGLDDLVPRVTPAPVQPDLHPVLFRQVPDLFLDELTFLLLDPSLQPGLGVKPSGSGMRGDGHRDPDRLARAVDIDRMKLAIGREPFDRSHYCLPGRAGPVKRHEDSGCHCNQSPRWKQSHKEVSHNHAPRTG